MSPPSNKCICRQSDVFPGLTLVKVFSYCAAFQARIPTVAKSTWTNRLSSRLRPGLVHDHPSSDRLQRFLAPERVNTFNGERQSKVNPCEGV
jgi:hypothetical protein